MDDGSYDYWDNYQYAPQRDYGEEVKRPNRKTPAAHPSTCIPPVRVPVRDED